MDEIIREHYPHLASLEREIQIRLQFVLSESDAPALSKGGWPCEALCSKIPTKMRAAGGPDVLIEFDYNHWKALDSLQQKALLHHELHHVEVVDVKQCTNPDGEVYHECRLDALQRPVVRLRKHDYECGGFSAIHELYADDSPEARQLEVVGRHLQQQVFPFAQAV
jgi:hypothetical protein